MFLKGMLCSTHSADDFKDVMGHDLVKTWNVFKTTYADSRLDSLDGAVADLDKFEDIRYPDAVLFKGMHGEFILKRAHKAHSIPRPPGKEPHYVVCLEDVDEIVKLVLLVGNQINTQILINELHTTSREILYADNEHPFHPRPLGEGP